MTGKAPADAPAVSVPSDAMLEGGEKQGEPPEASMGDGVVNLSRSEVRRRSLAGVFYITSSNIASLVIGFLGSLVIARLLTPSDFGVVAVGATAIMIAGALADGGLGAGLVRRPEAPTRQELRTVNGIQFALTIAVCLPVLAAAPLFGRTGAVTAVMIASLPIATLQAPGRVILARDMKYDRQLAIDFGSMASSQIFMVVAVVLGAGVWGLAFGAVLKAVVGTVLTAALALRFAMPSLRGWRAFGPLVRFGLSFQASWFMFVAREQGLNVVIAVVSGVAPLGIWTFTNRIFQLPLLAFSSLYVVGFPAMANLLAQGEDPRPIIMRTVRRAAIVGTFIFPVFAATSLPLIPVVFGQQWKDAAQIVPFICLSTLILGSISVAATSYLAASGRPGILAWATAALGICWIGITAALLPVIGLPAIGIGNLVGAIVETWMLSAAMQRTLGVSAYRPLLRPLAAALVAGSCGWLLSVNAGGGLAVAVASGALTLALATVGLMALCREDLGDTLHLARGAIRGVIPPLRRPSAESA